MSNPKISVIIPVYNVEQYLRECLESVVNQSFRDLEIICVNDGSTDGSPAILEEYAAKDNRFRIVAKENGGAADARNAGLSIASGDYILFVDSDDYLDLNACQILYSKAVESNSDMVMFLLQCFGVHDHSTSEETGYFPSELTDNFEKIQYEFNNWQAACSNLFCRRFIERNNIRFHNEVFFEDVPFVAQTSLLANKIAIVPSALYYYRQRDDSKMSRKQQLNHLNRPQCFQVMFEDVLPLAPEDSVLLYLFKYKYRILYDTYYKIIDKSLRPELGNRIKQNVSDFEREFMTSNRKSFDIKLFSFFAKFSGLKLLRWISFFKNSKAGFFDWLVKRIVPYSPWLQHSLELVDNQRGVIKKLREQLYNQK